MDESLQGQGLGKAIVIEALTKCVEVLEGVAFRLIIVDAATPKARAIYEKFEFKPLDPAEFPNRLFLPVATAAKLVA
jgi:GNAT superfamily N-acetyltransferase